MKLMQRVVLALMGWGLFSLGSTARAEAPGIYYSWAELDATVSQCLGRATQVLQGQNMTVVSSDNSSVAGGTADTTAVFVCLGDPSGGTSADQGAITVMVIVSSTDESQASTIRDALIAAF